MSPPKVIQEDAKDKEDHNAEHSGAVDDEGENTGSSEQVTDSNEIEQPKNIPSPEEIASWKRAIGEEARNRFRLSLLTVKEGAEGRPRPIKEEEVEGPKVEKGKEQVEKLAEGEVIEKGEKAAEERNQEDSGGERNYMSTVEKNKEKKKRKKSFFKV